MNFLVKFFLEVVNLIGGNRVIFSVLKKLNFFDAVFVMYPADQQFADYFTFRLRQRLIKWKPFVTGIIRHPSGKRTLMFAVSSHIDGRDSNYARSDLHEFHTRVDTLRNYLGATTTHFAGTLPGRLTALKIKRGQDAKNEREATTQNVVKAILKVRAEKKHDNTNPVVVLGCKGYIGREVTAILDAYGIPVIGVDVGGVYQNGKFVSREYVKPEVPHLLVNITHPEAINGYIDSQMDSTTTVLNEVYPAPHDEVVQAMRDKGVDVYHVAGVKASVLPPFPSSYQGAIPCCAALGSEVYDVVVIQL